jgi:hypothetical protein
MSELANLRAIALSLPETVEEQAWEMPVFKVRNKIFAAVNPKHGVGIRIARAERENLVRAEPEKFYKTDHDEKYDFMRLHLEAIEPDELRELLTDAWLGCAGPKLAAKYEL